MSVANERGGPSSGAESSTVFEALSHYWFPVARSAEVTDKPTTARLLDKPIVLWRSKGRIAAFYDLCIHRGTPLSLGWTTPEGELVCGYHGWHYNCEGACTWIPSLPEGSTVPSRARAQAYSVEDRYGLVWVCMTQPWQQIPFFPPEFKDPAYKYSEATEGVWQCNAARFIENMMDTSHFAWVHPDIFGTIDSPVIRQPEITHTDYGFTYTCLEPIGNMVEPRKPHTRVYELTFPFMILFRVYQPHRNTEHDVIWFSCCPLSARETKWFFFKVSDYEHPLPRSVRIAETQIITSQDRGLLEAQRPEELPLDMREELHLRGPDHVALEYRRELMKLGVDWQ